MNIHQNIQVSNITCQQDYTCILTAYFKMKVLIDKRLKLPTSDINNCEAMC